MRRAAKALLVATAALAAVLAVLLSTTAGQSLVMRHAVHAFGDGKIAVGALEGSLFGSGSIEAVRLSDADGEWLTVRGISFSWSPSHLLSGRLAVSHLHLESVVLARRPSAGPSTESAEAGSGFALPLAIHIGDLDIKAIDLLAPVMGETVRLRIAGNAKIDDMRQPSDAQVRLTRLDGARGELIARLAYSPEKRGLDVRIDGNEPEGGTVSRLLGMPSRPALTLNVNGRGGFDAWRADLALTAAGTPFIAGAVRLDAQGEALHRLEGQIAGYIDRLVPPPVAELLGGRTDVTLTADVAGLSEGSARSIGNARLEVLSSTMRLGVTGGADLARGTIHGTITGRVGRADGQPLTFSDGGAHTVTVREIDIRASLPDAEGARAFTATAGISGLGSDQGSIGTVALIARATQREPDGDRAFAFDDINVTVTAGGIAAGGSLGDAVGQKASARLLGAYDGGRLMISALDAEAAGAKAKLSGTLDGALFEGTVDLAVADLSRYAALAHRPLKGALAIDAKVVCDLGRHVFSATIHGKSSGIATGVAPIDGLLAADATYGARIERSDDGTVRAREATIANPTLSVRLNGHHGPQDLALSGGVTVTSLAAIDPRLGGKARLDLDVGGRSDDLTSKMTLTGDGVTLDGKTVSEPSIVFSGRGPLSRHIGKLAISGRVAGESVSGAADIALSDSRPSRIDGLDLEIAGARLAGDLVLAPHALPSGRIKLDAKDLGRVGRSLGVPVKGRVTADVELTRDAENGLVRLNVTGDDIIVGDVGIESVRSSGKVSNYLAAPDGALDLKVSRIVRAGDTIGSIALGAQLKAGAATFKGNGQLQGGAIAIAGKAQSANGIHEVEVASFSYAGTHNLPRVALSSAARLSIGDGGISTRALELAIGAGTLRVAGSASGKALDLSVALKRLPASIAAAAAPTLGIAGTIDGTATIRGTPSKPHVVARIAATGMSVRETRDRQLPPIDIATTVDTADNRAKVAVTATARGGLELLVDGTIGLDSQSGIALAGRGKVPLSLANVFLADRSARAGGVASVSADIAGRLSDPRVNGRVTLRSATLNDPTSGIVFDDIAADVGFTAERIDVRTLVAKSKKGGEINASGSVLLPPGGSATMDVGIRLAAFKFGDQDPVAGELDGQVTVSGPLSAPVARGDVLIKRMDITVPNKLPQSVTALDIRHVNAPKGFQSEDRRDPGNSDAASAGLSLSVDVQAYDRIFVRGRGVDAQLGGRVKIRGTADQPVTDGQFSMTRGRLSIIGRQLDFSRGNIVFMGSMVPKLDMKAAADVDGTTVTVTVSGQASDPKISFSSTPELPEDEIVSLLLFNKTLASLSPTQLVTLAGEVDKIGGLSSGPGTLDKMKSALGIDVLDVTTDKSGQAQATAGSYINDKTYVGVKQGMSLGNTRIVIDHNLTKHLKARGEMGPDGDSKLGLGVEWDY